MYTATVCVLLWLVSPSSGNLASQTCDVTNNSVLINPDADSHIAVVFGLRKPGTNGYGCGELTDSMQYVEAITWTLNRLNQNSGSINGEVITQSYIPGLKLGVSISDSCQQPYLSTTAAVLQTSAFYSTQYQCQVNNSRLLLGMIGDRDSDSTETLASVLTQRQLPLISFKATETDLHDNPAFMRTAPSSSQTAQAMISLLSELQWERFTVIYSDDSMHEDIYEQLMSAATTRGLCVTTVVKLKPEERDQKTLQAAMIKASDSGSPQVVYLGSSPLASALVQVATSVPVAFSLQWILSFGRNNTFASQYNYNNGMLTLEPRERHIAEFEDYWVRIVDTEARPNNPWYQEAYMTGHNCKLPGVTSAQFTNLPACTLMTESQKRATFTQKKGTEAAVMSLYSYANALKQAHSSLCGGTPGLCSKLAGLTTQEFYDQYLKVVDFTFSKSERVPTLASTSIPPYNSAKRVHFDPQGDPLGLVFDIYNYKYDNTQGFNYVQVGSYMDGTLSLSKSSIVMYSNDGMTRTTALAALPMDVCTGGRCMACHRADSMKPDVSYLHVPGDILIGSTFAVHTPGMSWVECDTRYLDALHGAQFVEAFLFAINQVNKNKVLRNLKLGAVAFDNCMSHVLKSAILTEFHTKRLTIEDDEGRMIDPASIHAYIGGFESNIAESLEADIVGPFIPVLAYGHPDIPQTQPLLTVIPFTPTINHGMAMGAVLRNLNHSYVQIIYEHIIGQDLQYEKVEHLLEAEGICVAGVYSAFTLQEYRNAVKQAAMHKSATALIFVSATPHVGHLLEAIQSEGLQQRFTLFGLELGGKAGVAIQSLNQWHHNVTDYMMTLSLPHPVTSQYQQYLAAIDPVTYATNPWFKSWYQTLYKCTLTNDTTTYATKCSNTPITAAPSFMESPLNTLVTNGVYVTANAIHKALFHYCGENYTSVCGAYRTATQRGMKVTEYMREAEFYDPLGMKADEHMFYHSVASTDINFVMGGQYTKIGSYDIATKDDPESMTLDHSLIKSKFATSSVCTGVCSHCLKVIMPGKAQVSGGDLVLGGLFDIHDRGVGLFGCGGVGSVMSYQHYAAFNFALQMVNKGSGPVSLRDVKLGSVAMDTCVHAIKGATLMSALHSGLYRVDNVSTHDVIGWITHTKDEVPALAAMATGLQVPLIGPNPILDSEIRDQSAYYAMMTTMDQHTQGLSSVISLFGWKFVHIALENYQTNPLLPKVHRALTSALTSQAICVLETFMLPRLTPKQVIANVLKSPTQVIVVYSDNIQAFVQERKLAGQAARNIVIIHGNLMSNMSALSGQDTQGFITIMPDISPVPAFDQYIGGWTLSDHTEDSWFLEYFQFVHRCDYGISFHYGTPCNSSQPLLSGNSYRQDLWLSRTINAVLAMSVAADRVLRQFCGSNYTKVCSNFRESDKVTAAMVTALQQVTFQGVDGQIYKFNSARQNDIGYKVYVTDSTGNFKQFGLYEGGQLTLIDSSLTSLYTPTLSGCSTQCARCTAGTADIIDETFTFVPGDLILAGVFDIHERGSSPFTCSTTLNSRQGYQLLEAFNYALSYVNNKRGMFSSRLTGVRLGSFSLDSCKSATRIGNLVANIHSQTTVIQSGDQQVNPDNIASYIGAIDSDSSRKIAEVLSNIGVTQISYGATSVTLHDRQRYPYFLRTVPSDDKQAEAIVAFLRDIDVDYVQVLLSDDMYGKDAAKIFSDLAYQRRICVAQQTTLKTVEGDLKVNADVAVSNLLVKSNASVVIVFLGGDYILPFLQAAQRNAMVKDSFKFVGSETWADNNAFLNPANQAQSTARNSISLGVETNDVEDFDRYLNNITAHAQKTNPWFREFYEEIYQCSLTASDVTKCQNPNRGVTLSGNYKQDQYVLYVINAVFAAALGIDSALTDVCGQNYSGLCAGFRYSQQQRQKVFSGTHAAKFQDLTDQRFEFTPSGGSTRGYHLYTVVSAGQGAFYTDTGSYNTDPGLTLSNQVSFSGNWDSSCSVVGVCTGCAVRTTQRSPLLDKTGESTLNIVGFFGVHSASVRQPLQCGPLGVNTGFHNMLAFYYALENLPGNIAVGGVAMDTCGSTARTSQGMLSLATGENFCGNELNVKTDSVISYLTLGNSDTNAIANLIDRQAALIVSPSATDSSLLTLNHYLSAVTPDHVQWQVLADVVQQMSWYYVTVIHSNTIQGQSAANSFIQASRGTNGNGRICVSGKMVMDKYSTLESAKAVLIELSQRAGVRVVLLMVTKPEQDLLLQAADQLNLRGRFLFISNHGDNISGAADSVVRGSIYLKPKSSTLNAFYLWVSSLTLKSHGLIPDDWFEEFWQHANECRLPSASTPLAEYPVNCPAGLSLQENVLEPSTEAYNTMVTTQMLAQGVFDLQQCRNTSDDLQTCFHKLQNKYATLYQSVSDATWVSPDRNYFRFMAEGYGNSGMDVYNYQVNSQGKVTGVKVGSWDAVTGVTTLDQSNIVMYNALGEPDTGFSSLCPIGVTCECVDQTGYNGTGGYVPGNQPTPAPLQQYNTGDYFSSAIGIILVALTCLGIIVTILLFVYLLVVYPVKGGTSILGYVLLLGVLLLYILNFAFIVYPTYEVCAVRRFSLGVVYSLIFACMLVKVLNTWRIGDAWDEFNPPTYERLSHPCSLLCIVFGLVLVQVVIGAEWLILRHPDVESVQFEGKLLARCSSSDFHNEELVMSCIYVMFLILITMVFAGVTWDSEENNKESRWILVTCIFTIIIWIIWTIVTTLSDLKFRDPAIVIASLVNATVILLCIYIRKLYLLSKIQKEIDEDKKSQMSTLSREKLSNHGNGYYVNPAYSSVEVGSLRSHKSSHYGSHRSNGTHTRSHLYQANAAGADVAY